ncbi:MAG: hypothetical protein LBE57_02380 [Methanosarcinales archaeon]|jgi:hypothetical protein|nr:hypothetical protein [Methanosarcinales archaeon]
MGKNNIDHSNESEEYADLVEPKISKYLRYFVLFVLFVSIALVTLSIFMGLEGMTPDEILYENIFYFFFIIMTLIYMSLPGLIQKKMGFVVDQRLIVVITLFIFAGTFLGQVFHFFDHFTWWDKMLHAISGVILGLIAFALVSALNNSTKAGMQLNPFFVALFSFTFAVAVGALWEIAEYMSDWLFGTAMQCWDQDPASFLTGNPIQGAAIIDTMEDLMVSTIGALIVSVTGYFYLSRGKPFMSVKRIRTNGEKDDSGSKENTVKVTKNEDKE